jgi:hypothetical protein
MRRQTLWAAMLSAGLLAACGGGGNDETPPVDNSASVSMSGVAAKGLMANALVSAHAVSADGSIASAALASTTTDAAGQYSLSFAATKDQPVVIRVQAKDDGSTTHLDEVSGAAQALPAGFTMRALFVPNVSGAISTSASVTPFSEMAVAAAEQASGGVTAANAAQAISTVTQLLGFNPSTVTATTVAAASGTDEQKLAVLLTAVSQLADSGALGCDSGSAGDKVRCVVETLADASSTGSIKLAADNAGTVTDVSAALATAVQTVLADPALAGEVSATTMTGVIANLGCSGETCAAAPVAGGSTPDPVANAITSAKLLFAELKSDWAVLFSRGGVSSIATGATNAEAWKFRAAMTGVQVPAEMAIKDLGALLMGADLYNDYQAGRETGNSRGRAPGVTATDTSATTSNYNAVGCSLYQDSATTTLATAPANANFIGCRAGYFVSTTSGASGTVTTEWRHGFTITPNADGSFGYATRARKRVTTCLNGSCTTNSNEALQADAYAGTLTPTLDDAGSITAFSVSGELPGAFKSGSMALANERHSWNLSGTRTIAGFKQETSTLEGNVVAYNADASVAGTLTVKSGTSTEIPVTADGHRPSAADPATQGELATLALNLVWATPAAEFEGVLAATDSAWDQSLTAHAPTQLVLSGALRNIADGVTTEFVKGVFSAGIEGYAAYDTTQADSAANHLTGTFSFVGTVTAPSRPTLQVTLGAAQNSHEDDLASLTLQYRSFVAGAPRLAIDVTSSRAADGTLSYKFTEASANLSLNWVEGAASTNLVYGSSQVIGTLVPDTARLTFSDNSFMSLDIGL